jgi:hypothetical protein
MEALILTLLLALPAASSPRLDAPKQTAPERTALDGARVTQALLVSSPTPEKRRCRSCGAGIPDANLTGRLRLGADSSHLFSDRLRVYLKLDSPSATQRKRREVQLSIDVESRSQVLLLGSRF